MSSELCIQTGRALLEEAHQAAAEGLEVFLHVEGFRRPLPVKAVTLINEASAVAKVLCWADKAKAQLWTVPVHAVRAVQSEPN